MSALFDLLMIKKEKIKFLEQKEKMKVINSNLNGPLTPREWS